MSELGISQEQAFTMFINLGHLFSLSGAHMIDYEMDEMPKHIEAQLLPISKVFTPAQMDSFLKKLTDILHNGI